MSTLLVRTAERLAAMLDHETAILRSATPGDIAALQEEKTRLAQTWSDGIGHLAEAPPLPAAEQAVLKEAARQLEAALARNERVLRAVTIATDRVVSAIADAVRDQRSCGVGYGMRRQAPRTRAPASGIAVDRTL